MIDPRACDGCGEEMPADEDFVEEITTSDGVHVGICEVCQLRGLTVESDRDSRTGHLSAWVACPSLSHRRTSQARYPWE